MKDHHLFFNIIILALIIKLSLFSFAAIKAPQGKMLPDSHGYLRLADTLTSTGVFATQSEGGALVFETFRTSGYPLFLAILHGLVKIPLDGIIFLQIAMTLLVAFVTYKTALMIEPKNAKTTLFTTLTPLAHFPALLNPFFNPRYIRIS